MPRNSDILEALSDRDPRPSRSRNRLRHSECRRRCSSSSCMNQFSALLNSTLDTAVVREKALEGTCKLLRCETASLLLVDRQDSRALLGNRARRDRERSCKSTCRLPIDDRSIAGYVAMTGESLIVNDVQNDPRHFKKSRAIQGGFQTRTMVCVPLKRQGPDDRSAPGAQQASLRAVRPSRHSWPDLSATRIASFWRP